MTGDIIVEQLLLDDEFGCSIVAEPLSRRKHMKNKKLPLGSLNGLGSIKACSPRHSLGMFTG